MSATLAITERRGQGTWPSLALAEWKDSLDTVHRWMQIVGKTRLALAPSVNHWWHITLYLTARGLTTSPMPYGVRSFEVEFDFIDHNLLIRTSEGATRALALVPRTVADFYREYMGMLDALGFRVTLRAVPSELEDTLRFDQDREHRSYDPDYVSR